MYFAYILPVSMNYAIITRHESDILFILSLCYDTQSVHPSGMFPAGGNQVDARRFNGAVAKHVRQFHDVLAGPVKQGGKEMPQIVGK